jgi:mannose/fructose/N-acetylgalactosamine-specific phosphotransferase system component IID
MKPPQKTPCATFQEKPRPDRPQAPRRGAVGRRTLAAAALRSLFLEASWNHIGQQNAGFLAAVAPALETIWRGRPDELAHARLRALNFFNTNPTVSGLVIGAAVRLEEETAAGRLSPTRRAVVLNALASALAAQGDRLFWQAWLPLCCLAGWLAAAVFHRPWGPLLTPALYCALAWPVRFGGFFWGYREGGEIYAIMRRWRVSAIVRGAEACTLALAALASAAALQAACGGRAAGLLAGLTGDPAGAAAAAPLRALACGLAVVFAVWLFRRLSFRRGRLTASFLYPALLIALTGAASLL